MRTETEHLLDKNRNYVVRRGPDNTSSWWYQLYATRLKEYSGKGDFHIVVICDVGVQTEKVIAIPWEYLRDEIIPHAKVQSRQRYMFHVDKGDLRFNWGNNISMDDRQFLVEM